MPVHASFYDEVRSLEKQYEPQMTIADKKEIEALITEGEKAAKKELPDVKKLVAKVNKQMSKQFSKGEPQGEQKYILISSSMPSGRIVRLVNEAKKLGVTVAIRGFKNDSFKETVLWL